MDLIKKEMDQFRKRINDIVESNKDEKTDVYFLGTQFFRLNTKRNEK